MSVVTQFTNFIFFVILGIIISCIFDIFRALRKVRKKNSMYVVMIQDIIFFAIVTIISIFYMVTIIKEDIRGYMFLGIFFGIAISRKILSKFLISFYSGVYYILSNIIIFLCVPIELQCYIFCNIIKKIKKICCKLFFIMINLKCKLLTIWMTTNNYFKRRGLKNESKSKNERKKSAKKEK